MDANTDVGHSECVKSNGKNQIALTEIPTGRVKQCVRQIEFEATNTTEQTENVCVIEKDLSLNKILCANETQNCDGNDSGVDAGATPVSAIALQRALSSNSAGYASSSGGVDIPIASCNSSLLSVCSDMYKNNNAKANDCTSEGGSESSSLSNGPTIKRSNKKRVGLVEPTIQKSSRKTAENQVAKSRVRAASANRAAVQRTSLSGAPNLATSERARSRDKQTTVNSNRSTSITRSVSLRRAAVPDSLPMNLKDVSTPNQKNHSRTPSISQRTPSCTPSTDDGRWPSIGGRGIKNFNRNGNNSACGTPDSLVIKTKIGSIVLDNKSNNDKFATLPRRRREKSEENLYENRSSRSNSATRDRMTSSTIVRRSSYRESPSTKTPHLPRSRKISTKTMIYHEASIQTAITCRDMEDAFAGNPRNIRVDAVLTTNKAVQSDIRDKEIERLQEKIKQLNKENSTLHHNLNEKSQNLLTLEQKMIREREEKSAMEIELKSNTERVLSMLEMVHAPIVKIDSNCDSLLMLESQIQLSGHALEEKQSEINTLRSFCSELQNEMSRSLRVQQTLLEERKCFERETTELQDFLQDEKTAIFEALNDAEAEVERYKNLLEEKENEVTRLQDECRHLVRISEQRRQEYLGMQSKYAALESKSKDMIFQRSNAVSGASLALNDLGLRLRTLIDQLTESYNISEQELEDIIYHNEAYTNSSGDEQSPNTELPERKPIIDSLHSQRNQTIVTAILTAIKSAANSAKKSIQKRSEKNAFNDELESEASEMLDSETEPCLMMENVIEEASIPDSNSQNMISSTNSLKMVTATDATLNKDGGDSLHNLCEAIENRQKIEQQTNLMLNNRNANNETLNEQSNLESIDDVSSLSERIPTENVIDRVICVDNLVTKLLKVLRIIQMENDKYVEKFINEKKSLQLSNNELNERLKQWEKTNSILKNDLNTASEQLSANCTELLHSKTELIKSRNDINKFNDEISKLNSADAQNRNNNDQSFKSWIVSNNGNETDILPIISSPCNKESSLSVSISDSQNGQDEAITKAIETLNGIQSIVVQCPALVELQRDLELMLPMELKKK